MGFNVKCLSGDRHIKQLKIHEDNGALTVAYRDQNIDDDDSFVLELLWTYIPRSHFSQIGESSGTAHRDLSSPIPVGKAVLRGFSFTYASDDHHLAQIKLLPDLTGSVSIAFRDEDGHEDFDWVYEWGILLY